MQRAISSLSRLALSSHGGGQKRAASLASLKNLQRKKEQEKQAEAEERGLHAVSDSSQPWMYRVLDEERLGGSRNLELARAHKLEFQRLYIPDLKLPGQEETLKLGHRPQAPPYTADFGLPDPSKYTVEAKKIFNKEDDWGKDSIRQQLDGWDPRTRQDLTDRLRADVPVPDLDWTCQFPMWNPRKFKGPRPRKGRLMYMYALAKGSRYVFQRSQKGVYSQNVSYRGLA
ncbi:hypothetical protein DIPPA_17087 [Diplonema papillatum]|nr:hypothetical protein DIPPA_17087 [Diplonema papillatum]